MYEMFSKVISTVKTINEYPPSILFDFEYVDEIILNFAGGGVEVNPLEMSVHVINVLTDTIN